MENAVATNRKTATVAFMASGILVGVAVKVLLDTSAALATGAFGRALASDLVHHGIPVLAAIVVFVVLQSNANVRVWGDEVVSELRKVVWPSREDTMRMTLVTIVMLLLSGAFLGLLDVFSGKLIEWILSKNIFGFLG